MNSSTASVHVTKLAAAQRQLHAAIRLYFMEEDELAIHSVASAAYKIIADLKAERGMNEAADHQLTSIFYVVRDYRRGTLPKHITGNKELMAWVVSMAEQLPIGPDTKVSGDYRSRRCWWYEALLEHPEPGREFPQTCRS